MHYPLFSARRDLFDITYLRIGPSFPYVFRRTDGWRPSGHTDTNAAGSPTAYRSPQAVCKAPSRGVFLFCVWWGRGDLAPEPSTTQIRTALEFSQFRFKLIEFLKLPFDIGEPALREVLKRTSSGVYRNYLTRAARVDEILKSEDTLEMSAPAFG